MPEDQLAAAVERGTLKRYHTDENSVLLVGLAQGDIEAIEYLLEQGKVTSAIVTPRPSATAEQILQQAGLQLEAPSHLVPLLGVLHPTSKGELFALRPFDQKAGPLHLLWRPSFKKLGAFALQTLPDSIENMINAGRFEFADFILTEAVRGLGKESEQLPAIVVPFASHVIPAVEDLMAQFQKANVDDRYLIYEHAIKVAAKMAGYAGGLLDITWTDIFYKELLRSTQTSADEAARAGRNFSAAARYLRLHRLENANAKLEPISFFSALDSEPTKPGEKAQRLLSLAFLEVVPGFDPGRPGGSTANRVVLELSKQLRLTADGRIKFEDGGRYDRTSKAQARPLYWLELEPKPKGRALQKTGAQLREDIERALAGLSKAPPDWLATECDWQLDQHGISLELHCKPPAPEASKDDALLAHAQQLLERERQQLAGASGWSGRFARKVTIRDGIFERVFEQSATVRGAGVQQPTSVRRALDARLFEDLYPPVRALLGAHLKAWKDGLRRLRLQKSDRNDEERWGRYFFSEGTAERFDLGPPTIERIPNPNRAGEVDSWLAAHPNESALLEALIDRGL